MNRIFYNTLIFICALFIGGVAIVFSIRPSDGTPVAETPKDQEVWSKLTVNSSQSNTYTVTTEQVDILSKNVSKDTPMLVDFGRLSSFLYLAPAGSQTGILSKSGSTGIEIGKVSGIISLYDLFLTYTIFDSDHTFRLEQFTNGSFYIGKEKDGKIAIYAIDGVVRLTLIHQGEDMTSLILFPGSYIRFDPSRNRSLKNADLFRTILSLKDTDNEVFEFVNPRVNIGDEQDAFFNYRLPSSSIVLFRALSTRFKERVDTTSIRKKYGSSTYNEYTQESSWLLNPSKKNHNMILELSFLLTKALDNGGNSDSMIEKIGTLYKQASSLNLRDSSAKALVEQFLLDGRFALYGGTSNAKYQQTYEDIAKIIGIERTDAKSKLFQSLADIYSRNLFTQKRTDARFTINTFGPTAIEIAKTFNQSEIERKDFFDIAIYAYNILRKMEETTQILPASSMEDPATYSYFMTFFQASNRYIESIESIEKKQQTIMSFSRQFYDYMLTLIVNSLYKVFVVTEDGALYINPTFREGIKVNMPEELLSDIINLNATVEAISPSIEALWSGSGETDTDTFIRIGQNIARIKLLADMVDPEGYKDYIKSPYKLDKSHTDFSFPELDPKDNTVARMDPALVEKIKNTKTLLTDPRIQEIKKIWTDADASSLNVEGEDIRISKASYKIGRANNESSNVEISALYKDKSFASIVIYYEDYTLKIVTDKERPMPFNSFKAFLLQLDSYLDFIDTDLASLGGEIRDIRIFPSKNRVNVGDSLYPVTIKDN